MIGMTLLGGGVEVAANYGETDLMSQDPFTKLRLSYKRFLGSKK
jgi:hypothetical protein